MEKKQHKMIVISFDALGAADTQQFRMLPNFSRFLENASYCFNVSSVYPSITYPAHTSIVTGCYPKNHGIINNTLIQSERKSPDWFWQRGYIRRTTIYDEVLKQGRKVASLLWPVSARSKITWNVPEIFANRVWDSQVGVSLRNGTVLYQAALNQKFGHLRSGKSQPQLDNFTHESLKYTLEKYQPDLTLVHFTDLDTQRHLYGTESDEARAAVVRHDRRLGEILDTVTYMGMEDDTNIIVLGDHYLKDTAEVIYLNHWFEKKGWITVSQGSIVQWKALCKNCDGSAYIYIRKGFGNLKEEVFQLLKELMSDGDSGIEQIIPGKEAAAMGADPRCSFMIEARDGYYFQDDWRVPMEEVNQMESGPGHEKIQATHGYIPGKPGYQTVFMAKGPDIKENVEIPAMCLIDEGPTMARLLGVDLGNVDGRVLEQMMKG